MDIESQLRSFVSRGFLDQSYRRFNAHRIGLGFKRVDGKFTDTLSVVFVVQAKQARAALGPRRRIPETLRLVDPASGEEMTAKTDVIALPPAELEFTPGAFNRPAPGGSRIFQQVDPMLAGTLGGWVWDKTDDSIVFLTNRHVIGSNIGATINQGSSGTLPDGDTLRLGAVKRAAPLTPLTGMAPYPESMCSYADASIGSVDNTADIGLATPEIGLAVFATAGVGLLKHVEMYGSITEYRQGRITLYPTAQVFPIDGQDAGICDLFQMEPLEVGETVNGKGDSGKLIFNINEDGDDPNPCVGLHFAGGGSAAGNDSFGLACPIRNVFDSLDLDTLCAGGFAGFLDALFGDAVGGAGARRAVTLTQSRSAPTGFFKGVSRAVEARLNTTEKGKVVAGAVRHMRGDLMQMAMASGDVQRMAAAAIGPIVSGCLSVDDLFDRKLKISEVEMLQRFLDHLNRHGNARIKAATGDLAGVFADAAGKRIKDLV